MANSNNSDGKSFWTTIPGLLTAIAALITAIVGLLTFLYSRDGGVEDGRSPARSQGEEELVSPSTQAPTGTECPPLPDEGVCVVEVIAGSPADRAGVKVGHIIAAVGGRSVENVEEFQTFLQQIHIGDSVLLSIVEVDVREARIHRKSVRVKPERIEGSNLRFGVRVEDIVLQERYLE